MNSTSEQVSRIATLFHDANAPLFSCTNEEHTPLTTAIIHQNKSAIDIFLSFYKISQEELDIAKLTLHSIEFLPEESLEKIVSEGLFDEHAKDSVGHTTVHIAAFSDNVFCLDILKDRKVDLDTRNSDGCRPIQLAVQEGCVKAYLFLKEHRCSLTEVDKDGNGLLHYLARAKGHPSKFYEMVINDFDEAHNPKITKIPRNNATIKPTEMVRYLEGYYKVSHDVFAKYMVKVQRRMVDTFDPSS